MRPKLGLFRAKNLLIVVASRAVKRAEKRCLMLQDWNLPQFVVVNLRRFVNWCNICAFRSLLWNHLAKEMCLFFKIITLSVGHGRAEGRLERNGEFMVALLASH